MGPDLQLAIVMLVFLLLLGVGMTIPFAIGVPAVVYLYLQGGLPSLRGLGLSSWGSMNSFTLMAIPLFILMAELMQRSGLTLRIYDGLSRLVSRIPGGLLQTSIVGCAVFASISGSSIVTAASIGGVALPELMKRGYDSRISAGSLAAGGTLGILFPPSVAMIIYSTFTDTSVAKLFLAGILPGVLLTVMFMLYIAVATRLKPALVGQPLGVLPPGWLLRAIAGVAPFILLMGCTLGSIYAGIATPTEAASLGCLAVILLALLFGQLTWRIVADALGRTVVVVGNILFIVYTAFLFSYAISFAGVGETVTGALVGLDLSRPAFFAALFVLYTILGCLVESIGMIVITVPLLYPVLIRYGIDPIWFGVILVMFIELGQISPPIGINLFVIQGMWKGRLSDVVAGTIPFHLLMLLLLLAIMVFPQLALWLPSRW
jgi:C4-dicarboxylate transporter DctM subunit